MPAFLEDPLSGALIAAVLLLCTGATAWLLRFRARTCQLVGQGGTLLAGVLGVVSASRVLISGRGTELQFAWGMPQSSLHFGMDSLSAFFLLPIFGLTAVAALYGRSYFHVEEHSEDSRLGANWLYLDVLAVGMVGVVLARDGLLFLLAWEIMALAPFFLVAFDHERPTVRRAAWIYMVATHLGTACLLVMFQLLGGAAGSLDFGAFATALGASPGIASVIFVLAVLGFGSKAGFLPLHVWLPEAHPVAPSHISALMSGVMIKTGIYGLIRVLTFVGPPPAWWGWTLIVVGLTSGVLGVVFALAQHDLKRLLAYHSVENIGIIAIGLGIGLIGLSADSPALAVLGFAGALLHVLNHSVFKALLFLAAGAVAHGAKTLDLDRLGGLQKRMPWTGTAFLVGSIAIVGLPPLNGFISEFLIFYAASNGMPLDSFVAFASVTALGGLGLISGLAAACFVKAYGAVFSGEPRNATAAAAEEVPLAMRAAMLLLAIACLSIGLTGPLIVTGLRGPVIGALPLAPAVVSGELATAATSLFTALIAFALAAAVGVGAWLLRSALLRRAGVHAAGTWGCGYTRPTARMQYTATSFAQPLTRQLKAILRSIETPIELDRPFAQPAEFSSDTPDVFDRFLYWPLFRFLRRGALVARRLQHGNVHIYVLYVAVTLIALLLWKIN